MTNRLLSASLALLLAGCASPDPFAGAPDRAADWDRAAPFEAFLRDGASGTWDDHYRAGAPADLVGRARDVRQRWRLLVVADRACPDAVNSVPYLAAFADAAPRLELRVLPTSGNETLLAGHETFGRQAHPLVLILDDSGREVASWIERPRRLADWIESRRDELDPDVLRTYRNGFYAGNRGRDAIAEILELVAAAERGERLAPAAAEDPAAPAADEITPCPAPTGALRGGAVPCEGPRR